MNSANRSRREFCRRSAAVSGGLVLAMTLPAFGGRGLAGRPRAGGASAPEPLNAWLKIGTDDSVTVLVDRSEMGQGVYTALPTLLAEELEIELPRINIVAAPVGDAYVNALNGGQVTGTSNSVTDAWEKLRTAGAQARLMLISAAAQKWRVDPSSCSAKDGKVISAQGKVLSYGQLAEAAAKLPVPKDVKLKPKSEYRLIGRSLPRLDTPGKVDGSAEFGLDVKLPGMLYAAIALPPTLGGKAASVDSADAERCAGVKRVLNTDSGVVVVADHFWQALKARDALKINWDAGANAHLDNASIFSLLAKTAASNPGLSSKKIGDPAAAIKSASKAFSAVYELPMLAHATMEPMNCTADVQLGPLRFVCGHSSAAVRAGGRGRCGGFEARASQRPHHAPGRRLRPAAGSRFHSRGGAGVEGAGRAGQVDLDARRRHDARCLPSPRARRNCRRLRCVRQAQSRGRCTSPARRSPRASIRPTRIPSIR